MPVDTKHPQYQRMENIWKKARDVIAGQEAIHQAGELYLPKLSGQKDQDYKNYLRRALFYNATQRTLDAMSGLLFRKDPKVQVPRPMEPWLDNIDLNGNSLQTFAETTADEVLSVGRYGVLVDHPVRTEEVVSAADAERVGFRPFLTGYKAEDIINWNTVVINNKKILNLVVLTETVTVTNKADEFDHEYVTKYRVLDLDEEGFYRQRIYIEDTSGVNVQEKIIRQEGEDIYPTRNGEKMRAIPFLIISSKDADFDVVKPPMLDLINVNVSHYKTSADLEHGAHFTGLPTVITTGHTLEDGKKLKIGSASAWVFPEPEANAFFLEFKGEGLEALEKRMDVKQQQMATLGARLLADESAMAETAEAHIIKRQGENSALCTIATNVSHGIQVGLKVMAEWVNLPSEDIVYQINKDFLPSTMEPAMILALLQSVQSGSLSFSEFVRNLQQGEIISADKTPEDIMAEIDASGLGGQGLGGLTEEDEI